MISSIILLPARLQRLLGNPHLGTHPSERRAPLSIDRPHGNPFAVIQERRDGSARIDHFNATPFYDATGRSEEHTSELKSLMRNSFAVFCLKKKTIHNINLNSLKLH